MNPFLDWLVQLLTGPLNILVHNNSNLIELKLYFYFKIKTIFMKTNLSNGIRRTTDVVLERAVLRIQRQISLNLMICFRTLLIQAISERKRTNQKMREVSTTINNVRSVRCRSLVGISKNWSKVIIMDTEWRMKIVNQISIPIKVTKIGYEHLEEASGVPWWWTQWYNLQ